MHVDVEQLAKLIPAGVSGIFMTGRRPGGNRALRLGLTAAKRLNVPHVRSEHLG